MALITTTATIFPHGDGDPTDPSVPSSRISIEKLLPALFQCFGIILCGYIAGRARIITSSQAKGLGNFVSKFALPALLFKNMVLLDFGNVIWPFIWSILIAKASVFAIVCVLTLVVSSPESRYSKAGLYSIFATQSNDFALGYPIVKALYESTHPEYVQYIYLVAPVSLMLLNPIGFAFCEVHRWKERREHQQGKLLIAGQVVLHVLRNPIVFMVIIGIGAHFILHQKIPAFMEDFVDGLATSFGGAALFYLGLSMAGHLKKLTRSTVVTLILLLTAKLLLLPLICKDMVDLLDNTNPSNQSSLSNYAFLYGVFPTAPSVAIYAGYYNAQLEVVISGMVISTLLSAPIMFTSAWLLTLRQMDPRLLMSTLQDVSFDISIVCLVILLWTIAVMFLRKKYKRPPHLFTTNLFVAQLLTCLGMIVWKFVVRRHDFVGQILSFTLLCTSLYCTYIWPGIIALSIVLLRRFEHRKVSSGWFLIAGWGIPAFITAVLLICGEKLPNTLDSSLFYSKPQIICSTFVLSVSILLLGGCLVFLSRESWAQKDQNREENTSDEDLVTEQDNHALFEPEGQSADPNTVCECPPSQPMPDMLITSLNPTTNTLAGQSGNCNDSNVCLVFRVEEHHWDEDRQVARHVLLCLLLAVSSLVNLSSCVWLLLYQDPGRLYVELQFFCVVANYGQGFVSFALFGLDKHFIILPFWRRLRTLWYGKRQEEQPQSNVSEEIRMTCTDFIKNHKEQCFHDIVRKKRCGVRTMVDCFLGCEFVEWLQQAGLAQDGDMAVLYGTHLLQGGVLQHIEEERAFQDAAIFYSFVT
ncbi:lysosomal cholesterol signaling protein [Syngnathus typhle]|uniref:lysosomal cholesterol signaling protein n=1 Tax=Syngnathus typhle TaxID=161592 RepID=UPI002A69BB5A|nr:lysosomal cholesterol signaling protein [Syngnathus typhle]XP_061142621.1 lysosomal cholesterol signaling protein [Syngnathus typhle]